MVVLTGGARRIDAGLDLLAEGRAARMLISGVNERTSGAAIADAAQGANAAERARLFDCCIDLGREALDTVGNAVEARDWIREHGFAHVLVVTADYHMPRALLEFSRALEPAAETPDVQTASVPQGKPARQAAPVRLTPWPVETTTLRTEDWYRDPRRHPPDARRMGQVPFGPIEGLVRRRVPEAVVPGRLNRGGPHRRLCNREARR